MTVAELELHCTKLGIASIGLRRVDGRWAAVVSSDGCGECAVGYDTDVEGALTMAIDNYENRIRQTMSA